MAADKDQFKYDKRLVEWYINNGVLTKAEYEKFLAQLPDLKNQAEYVSISGEKVPPGTRLN